MLQDKGQIWKSIVENGQGLHRVVVPFDDDDNFHGLSFLTPFKTKKPRVVVKNFR